MRLTALTASVILLASVTVACSTGQEEDRDPTAEGALRADTPGEIDEEIVGTWVDANGEQLLVHTLELHADGTFHAKGGCRSDESGTRRCYSVQEAKGRWSVGPATRSIERPIELRSTTGQSFEYDYTLGRLANLGDNGLLIRDGNKQATFKRLDDDVVPPNGICENGRTCSEGFECRSNCPPNAMCIVSILTCQPRARLQRGGICNRANADQRGECADGLICKDNCPPNAMCFASVFTCQPE